MQSSDPAVHSSKKKIRCGPAFRSPSKACRTKAGLGISDHNVLRIDRQARAVRKMLAVLNAGPTRFRALPVWTQACIWRIFYSSSGRGRGEYRDIVCERISMVSFVIIIAGPRCGFLPIATLFRGLWHSAGT